MSIWKEWSEKEVNGKTALLWLGGLVGTPVVLTVAQPPLRGMIALGLVSAATERPVPTAEDLANGIYAATVVRCYQMNDLELVLNQTLCKDALRRLPNR